MMRYRSHMFSRLAILAILLFAGGAMAARQRPDDAEIFKSLQGRLLVARPSMSDPRFAQTVILMVRHDRKGAFGLVVNRPLGSVEIRDPEAGADVGAARSLQLPAFAGGPVEPNQAFAIHSTDYRLDTTIPVAEGLAVTADRRILSDILAGRGPKTLLYVVGYSGWGPGQLEDEMRRKGWFVASASAHLVFGPEDPAAKWEKAMQLRIEGI